MRRATVCLAVLLAIPALAAAQSSRRAPAQTRTAGPPHAWLYGTWAGGLYPVLDGMLAQDCRMPTVAFSQDVVGHTTLTGTTLASRVIETVRTSPAGAEFRFSPDPADPAGFGCKDVNELHVARENNDGISFPNCSAFPYPLKRCPR